MPTEQQLESHHYLHQHAAVGGLDTADKARVVLHWGRLSETQHKELRALNDRVVAETEAVRQKSKQKQIDDLTYALKIAEAVAAPDGTPEQRERDDRARVLRRDLERARSL